VNLLQLARALGGDLFQDRVLVPGPGHSHRDRSLSVWIDPYAPDGIRVHSFAGDDWRLCRDHVLSRLGPAPWAGRGRSERPAPARLTNVDQCHEDARKVAIALQIFHEAQDPRRSPVSLYLSRRRLLIPEEAAGRAIRYHPHCPFADKRTPAMVCLVSDVVTDRPKAIHRTAITRDGQKAVIPTKLGQRDRLTLAPTTGGAIKFSPDAHVTTCLGIGEGAESTLSLRLTPEFDTSPVWSLLSTSGIAGLPVLAGIETLWIAVDNDENGSGRRAANLVADRWQCAGREVFLVEPHAAGADLNDLARKCRHA
jgi:putative DNA primase/helicase